MIVFLIILCTYIFIELIFYVFIIWFIHEESPDELWFYGHIIEYDDQYITRVERKITTKKEYIKYLLILWLPIKTISGLFYLVPLMIKKIINKIKDIIEYYNDLE